MRKLFCGLAAIALAVPLAAIAVGSSTPAVTAEANGVGQTAGACRAVLIASLTTVPALGHRLGPGCAAIIGPPLAAPLLFALGVQWALLLNAASFAVSFTALRSIRLPGTGPEAVPGRSGFRAEG